MRYPRLKPDKTATFMHVYNRTAGSSAEFPFQAAEQEEFIRRLKKLSEYYVIEPIAYQVMGNHFHLLLIVPEEIPSNEEVVRRYKLFHNGNKSIDPESAYCSDLAQRLRDISWFMKDLQQPFSRWFNRTRPRRRRGHLWADRFKNTILENGLSVWDCWKYIEMNPVRAFMVNNPAEYRFCSFGEWSARGKHPFEDSINKHLMPVFKGLLHTESLDELKTELRKEFARMTAVQLNKTPDQIDTAIAVVAEKEKFTTRCDRRVRYWVDGLVIGSELFVRNTVAHGRVSYKVKKRRLVRATTQSKKKQELYSFKQLRLLIE